MRLSCAFLLPIARYASAGNGIAPCAISAGDGARVLPPNPPKLLFRAGGAKKNLGFTAASVTLAASGGLQRPPAAASGGRGGWADPPARVETQFFPLRRHTC